VAQALAQRSLRLLHLVRADLAWDRTMDLLSSLISLVEHSSLKFAGFEAHGAGLFLLAALCRKR
jgi:hypothetical protein